jgi:hypothetical protein
MLLMGCDIYSYGGGAESPIGGLRARNRDAP